MRLESGTSLQHTVGWTRDMLRMVRYLANTEDEPFLVCSLSNVEDQVKLWSTIFPSIVPTHDVGANWSGEVLQCLTQQKVPFNITNKKQLEELMKLETNKKQPLEIVFRNSTKLGSHLKAAASAGVTDLYVDSPEELLKIKKYHGAARIHVELTASQGENLGACNLAGASGALLGELPLILSEANSLNLQVVGLALNLALGDLDHEENLGRLKVGLDIAQKAVSVARENDVQIETLHLGQICANPASLPRHYGQEVMDLLQGELLRNIKITAEASNFLVASSTVLASRIIGARAKFRPESMEYYINESVFGIFSRQLVSEEEESPVPAPLPLGGGGHRKGLSGKLLETAIMGPSGDDMDQILALGDIVLPRMEEGDWLLFPNMGTMNLADYVNSGRKVKATNSFICLKETNSSKTRARSVPSLKETCDKENVININLDLQNHNINFNVGSGLKGEIDLRKTFLFGN